MKKLVTILMAFAFLGMTFSAGAQETETIKLSLPNLLIHVNSIDPISYYELGEHLICQDSASATVARFAEDYLLGNIVSGKMLGSTSVTELTEELLIYHCTFSVVEMIGRVRNEGTIDIYGKDS